jgi:hypothetical protein
LRGRTGGGARARSEIASGLLAPLAFVGDRLLLGAVATVVPLTLALAAIAHRRPSPPAAE